jgi:hypothetical protein
MNNGLTPYDRASVAPEWTRPREPIDAAKIAGPTKGVALDGSGQLYPVADLDTWAGAWAFPPSWSEDDRKAWAEIQGNKIHETKRLETAVAALDAAANSPATLLANARAEVDEVQRAREAAERRALGEAAWLQARERFGDRAERLNTVDGDVIIQVAMTLQEVDVTNARVGKLVEAAGDDKVRAISEANGAHRDAVLAKIVHPAQDRVKALGVKRPELWADLCAMRDRLVRARADAEGKDYAP